MKFYGPVRQPCGDPKCSASTGICGNITFGKGRLDDLGYWSKPCKICEDAWIAKYGSTRET
jgi:hypothetical protein